MLLPAFFLQGKVLLVVFGKIQGLGLTRDALGGVILEPAALAGGRPEALLGTKDGIVIDLNAIITVIAGTLDFFTKQHGVQLSFCLIEHYIPAFVKMQVRFLKFFRKIINIMGISQRRCPVMTRV